MDSGVYVRCAEPLLAPANCQPDYGKTVAHNQNIRGIVRKLEKREKLSELRIMRLESQLAILLRKVS